MSWGAALVGFDDVAEALNDVRVAWGGETVYVTGTNVEYAVFVELGTSRQEAQPYLFRAARVVNRSFDRFAAEANSTKELVERLALEIEALAKKFAPVDTGNLQGSITAQRVR